MPIIRNSWPLAIYCLLALLPLSMMINPESFPAEWTDLEYSALNQIFAFLLLIASMVISLTLKQNRAFFALLSTLTTFLLTCSQWGITWLTADPILVINVCVVTLPLLYLIFFSMDEASLQSGRSYFQALLSLSPLYLTVFFVRFPEIQSILHYRFKFRPAVEWWQASDLGLFFILVFTVNVLTTKDRFVKDFKAALLLSLIPIVFTLGLHKISWHLLGYSFTSVILLIATIRLFWQRIYVDELTGIPNQKALEDHLQRLGPVYSIGIIDVDHFKKFNEVHGHETGDQALRMVAKHLDRETKSKVFRIEGNVFCMIFPEADPDGVRLLTERMCRKLSERRFFIRTNSDLREQGKVSDRGDVDAVTEKVQITISVGLVHSQRKGASPKQIMQFAEKALRDAKNQGRNRVVLADAAAIHSQYE